MISLINSLKKLIGIEDLDSYEPAPEEIEEMVKQLEAKSKDKNEIQPKNVIDPKTFKGRVTWKDPNFIDNAGATKVSSAIILYKPHSLNETATIMDLMKSGRNIIVCYDETDGPTASQIYNTISGAAYALEYFSERITKNTYVYSKEAIELNEKSVEKNEIIWDA